MSGMRDSRLPRWTAADWRLRAEAAEAEIERLRDELRIAQERGDGWRKRYDADTTEIRHQRARLDTATDHRDVLLGECLMCVRLALTAMALVDDGMSDDRDEPQRILAALCRDLVAADVVDPMEQAAEDS